MISGACEIAGAANLLFWNSHRQVAESKKGDRIVFLYIVVGIYYGSIAFCVIASLVRLIKFAVAPIHLRWEFYRTSSLYELSDWWARDHVRLVDKLKPVALEILFLRDYYIRNRGLWYFLFPFHVGIYLLILWHIWYLILPMIANIRVDPFWDLMWGHVATVLASIGGLGILVKRMTDEDLRAYYPPLHYLKWVFILLTLLGGFYAVHCCLGASMPSIEEAEIGLYPPSSIVIHALFSSAWLIYLPFSHILRLFFRYYHHVRWDDVPNVRGGALERKVKRLLDQPVRWSAPHIQSGKRWADLRSEREQGTGEERDT